MRNDSRSPIKAKSVEELVEDWAKNRWAIMM